MGKAFMFFYNLMSSDDRGFINGSSMVNIGGFATDQPHMVEELLKTYKVRNKMELGNIIRLLLSSGARVIAIDEIAYMTQNVDKPLNYDY